MGSPEPRSFSRGKRGIAGSLVFTLFDRDSLLDALADDVVEQESFERIGGDAEYHVISVDQWDQEMTQYALNGVSDTSATANSAAQITKNVSSAARPVYDDEIPPFDITVSFANEYGQKATIVLYGVEILNEATGFSIDNVTSEKACTFVARRVRYMQPVGRNADHAAKAQDTVKPRGDNA